MDADVLLINPPDLRSKYKRFFGIKAPPLGLAYIAGVLEKQNISVDILDCAALDLDFNDLQNRLKRKNNDLIGITSTTPTIPEALKTAEIANETLDAKIALGGPHPTFTHKQILRKNRFVDYVVRGEGEKTFLKLAKRIGPRNNVESIRGISYRENGNIEVNPDREPIEEVDELPFPARHLLPNDEYQLFNIKMPLTTMITSRGCPMQCQFCASSAMHGKEVRRRSPNDVVEEIEYVRDEFGIETVAFMDDTFTLFPDWVREFTKKMKQKNLEMGWGCTARADKLDKNLLSEMKEAGCHTLFVGVESGVQGILDNIQKGINLKEIRRAFKVSRDLGIRTIASLVLGLPGETKQSAKKTIEFVKEIKPDYALFSIATPYPGTKFYEKAHKKDLIETNDWFKYNLFSAVLDNNLGIKKTKKLQKKAFKKFYFRPTYILREIKKEGMPFLKVLKTIFNEIIYD
ncbi:B12-binding domain-containing radical SAM protein [archaeon SCG-AAA382B04]|nr:B12-binding domain-containing radical SAM protein [archaeon SCG-AAA382B04]